MNELVVWIAVGIVSFFAVCYSVGKTAELEVKSREDKSKEVI